MTPKSKRRLTRIGIALVFLLLAGYFGMQYAKEQTKKHSPFDTARYSNSSSGLNISVEYCRPYMKGRKVFGPEVEDEAQKALQPWGQYWRLGANEATEITFNKDVSFGGKPVKAGTYVLYAVPNPESWTIGLNTELDRWGYSEVDHDLDVLQVEVESNEVNPPTEQLTIDFSEEGNTVHMNIKWAQAEAIVPIEAS